MAQLAAQFSVRRDTISQVLKRSGVPIRTQRAMTDEQQTEAVRPYRAGCSLVRIGDQLGYNGETIRLLLKRQGVQRGSSDLSMGTGS